MKNRGGCYGCQHLWIIQSYYYSDLTWEGFSMGCRRNHWDTNGDDADQADLYQNVIVRGGSCEDYEAAPHAREEVSS